MLGTWSVIPSVVAVDVIASTGLDFVVIDAEHGPVGFETAQAMVMASESRGVVPLLRVEGVDEAHILKALDIGAHGIHVPNVATAREARRIVTCAKYPPLGERGFSPFTRAGNYSLENATLLTQRANENTLIVVHIEGQQALDELDSILAIDAIDVVFVGLFDLSKALGKPGQVNDPSILGYLEGVIAKTSSANKVVGTIAVSLQDAVALVDLGIRYITYLVDCDVLRSGYQEVVRQFRR